MNSLRITRERNALQTALKELKRTEVQELCRVRLFSLEEAHTLLTAADSQIHGINDIQRTKTALDAGLVDHFINE